MTRSRTKHTVGLYSKICHGKGNQMGGMPVFRGTFGSQKGGGFFRVGLGILKGLGPRIIKKVFSTQGKQIMKKVAPKILDVTLKKTQEVLTKKKTAKRAVREALNETIVDQGRRMLNTVGREAGGRRRLPLGKGHQIGGRPRMGRRRKGRLVIPRKQNVFDSLRN